VPRFRLRRVFGSALREYSLYLPDLSLRIMPVSRNPRTSAAVSRCPEHRAAHLK
jgi:hypothetical protein